MPKILLVDDDVVFGEIMIHVANRENVSLTHLDSFKGIGLYSEWSFDVAIVDFDLGNMTGLQFARIVESYVRQIPMILISSYQKLERKEWPVCIKNFVHKSVGPYGILAAAIDEIESAEAGKG